MTTVVDASIPPKKNIYINYNVHWICKLLDITIRIIV